MARQANHGQCFDYLWRKFNRLAFTDNVNELYIVLKQAHNKRATSTYDKCDKANLIEQIKQQIKYAKGGF